MEQALGKVALKIIEGGMVSSTLSTKPQATKPVIRPPSTVEEATALRAWADTFMDRPIVASPLQLTKHLGFMAATLPSKAIDDDSGKMRVAVYTRILEGHSNDALSYMALRACSELDWLPTPRQCLELLQQYRPPTSDRDRALMLCHHFWQGRFEDFIADLQAGTADQSTVDAAPLRWRSIAMERGYLRFMPDENRYVIRKKRETA